MRDGFIILSIYLLVLERILKLKRIICVVVFISPGYFVAILKALIPCSFNFTPTVEKRRNIVKHPNKLYILHHIKD